MGSSVTNEQQQIGLFDAIFTQRAIRSYKTDPVPREMILKVIEAATKAPSGGNSQPWAFVVVQDEAKRKKLAEWGRDGFAGMLERARANMRPGDPPPMERLANMMEHFEDIPVVIVACLVGNPTNFGSIYPAVQNLLLAARGLGLGALLSSGWAQKHKAEIKEMLDMPEDVEPVVYIPLGWPDKEHYGKTTRRPVSEVTHWDGWQGDLGNSAAVAHR